MIKRFTIMFVLTVFAGVSFSQGITDTVIHIESVTVTAERIFKKEEAGMKETTVDSLALMEKINLNLSDVLAENTTIYIKNYGRGALATASFRGTAPSHTQVSWNGININSPMLGMVDFSIIPVYIVDNMSLQHGAASVKESSGGLGGHISINNNVNWNNKFSGRYYQGIGSFSTFDEFGQVNVGTSQFQSKTRAYHNYSKNNYYLVNKQQKEIDSVTGKKYYPEQYNSDAVFLKYGLQQEFYIKLSPKTYTSAQVWYQNVNRSIPNVLSYEGDDRKTGKTGRQTDETLKSAVQIKHYGGKLKTHIVSGIDYQELNYVLKVKIGGGETNTPVNSGSLMKSWYNNARFNYTFSDKISSVLKFDANYFDIATIDSALLTGYDEKRMEYSAFGGMYFNLLKKINLSLELRQDLIPKIITPVIYNIGISYKPFEKHDFIIKSGLVRNFHNPALNDLYWQPGGNPGLLPEEGHTWETGLHYIVQSNAFLLENQLTVYSSNINNWILWLPSVKGYWEAMNIRKVKAYGVEYNLKSSYSLGEFKLGINGNYAFTRSLNFGEPFNENDKKTGSQLPFIPVHSANALFSLHFKDTYINYQYHFYGIRHTITSNKVPPENGHPFYRLYAQHLNHLTLGYNIRPGNLNMGAEFKINNLLNEVYRSEINRIMPLQNYTLLLMINF
ncbi:MAG: TonB-dependent receptor plug domain-containing protein [Bacteroidales bacterium]